MCCQTLDHTLQVSKQKDKKTQLISTDFLYFLQKFVYNGPEKPHYGVRSQFIFLYIFIYLFTFAFIVKNIN